MGQIITLAAARSI